MYERFFKTATGDNGRPITNPEGIKVVQTIQAMRLRLEQEGRRTDPCPKCNGTKIELHYENIDFFMACMNPDCHYEGRHWRDYDCPAYPHVSSWVYAVKRCHDSWNGQERDAA